MSKQLQRKFASPVSADLLAGQAEEALRREKFKDAIELLKQLVKRPSGHGRDLSLGSLGAFRLPSAIHLFPSRDHIAVAMQIEVNARPGKAEHLARKAGGADRVA